MTNIELIFGKYVGPMIEQTDVVPTPFVNVESTILYQQNANVGPTNDCYLAAEMYVTD